LDDQKPVIIVAETPPHLDRIDAAAVGAGPALERDRHAHQCSQLQGRYFLTHMIVGDCSFHARERTQNI
jgi:hypothetical protein